jgi:hypothetical protein
LLKIDYIFLEALCSKYFFHKRESFYASIQEVSGSSPNTLINAYWKQILVVHSTWLKLFRNALNETSASLFVLLSVGKGRPASMRVNATIRFTGNSITKTSTMLWWTTEIHLIADNEGKYAELTGEYRKANKIGPHKPFSASMRPDFTASFSSR